MTSGRLAADALRQPGTGADDLSWTNPATAAGPGADRDPNPPGLELQGLTVRFGAVEALAGVTATFRGRATGLLGPNGAGKTTLIRTLLGFHAPTSGTARIFGHDIRTDGRAVRAHLGYMPESDAYVAGMNAVRTVRLMAELSGLSRQDALERAHEALNFVGLGEARYRPVGTYSLGMRQLVKLAQAIVHGPRLLFLDEPTNALDPPARHRMLELIRHIRDSGDVQVIISSHILRDVETACDEVAILREGRLVARRRLGKAGQDTSAKAGRPDGLAVIEAAAEAASDGAVPERTLQLEVLEDPQPMIEALQVRGFKATVTPDYGVALELGPDQDTPAVYRVAASVGVTIRRLAVRQDTLEDIFLQAMSGSVADKALDATDLTHTDSSAGAADADS